MSELGELTSYLLTIDTSQSSIEHVVREVNNVPAVENWLKFMPSAAVLGSRLDVNELHHVLHQRLPDQRYVLSRLERGSKNGWLPKSAWAFINQPEPA